MIPPFRAHATNPVVYAHDLDLSALIARADQEFNQVNSCGGGLIPVDGCLQNDAPQFGELVWAAYSDRDLAIYMDETGLFTAVGDANGLCAVQFRG